MKTILKCCLIMLTLAFGAIHCHAEETEPNDTVYFYSTWEQVLNMRPMAMLVDPYIEAFSPFDVFIASDDEEVNRAISEKGFIAVSLGDSIWLASSDYLKQEFKGDVSRFSNFVPMFFNDKVVYLTYPAEPSFKEIIFGDTYYETISAINYYNIDFQNRKVKKVTHSYLSDLLEDYHDLQMRYEGMKDYKKRDIIEYFFLQYVERASQDFMRPDITDYVD